MIVTPLTTELVNDGNGIWTLKLMGSVDSTNRHLLWSIDDGNSLLRKLVEARAQKLVIDLTATERLAPDGLRYLFNTYQQCASHNIQIELQNPNTHLQRVLRIMRFDMFFIIQLGDS